MPLPVDDLPDFPDPPMRRLTVVCDADRPFELPLGATLGPYYAWRGLLGGVLTDQQGDLGSMLFKPQPVRGGNDATRPEVPSPPWRLRLGDLYARSVQRRFTLVLDVFGELPCARAATFVDALRLAGSGQPYLHWHTRKPSRWGLDVYSESGSWKDKVLFTVADADLGTPQRLTRVAAARAAAWPANADALLCLRTLTVLRERSADSPRGSILSATGELDAAALCDNALRRLAVLDVATRLDPAERTAERLARTRDARERYVAALLAEAPLACADTVTVPLQRQSPPEPRLGGLLGSARFTGAAAAPWLAGFVACEWLGIGESTAYGAGQAAWTPVARVE